MKRALLGVLGALALVLAGYLVLVFTTGDRIPRGTTVAGVDIGGLTQEQAQQRLQQELPPARKVTLTAADSMTRVSVKRLGLDFDAPATVEAASADPWNPLPRITGGGEVDPVVTVDAKAMESNLAQLGEEVDRLLSEPLIKYIDLQPRVVKGKPGRQLEQVAAAELIAQRYLYGEPIDLPVVALEPTVSDETAAEVASTVAVQAVSGPVALTAEGITAEVSPQELATALFFEAEDATLVPRVRGEKIHEAVRASWTSIETPGKDATFVIRKQRPVVVPSKPGRGVPDEELAAAVESVLDSSGAQRAATVEVSQRDPELTTREARQLGITERLSEYTEEFPYARYREINIGRAAQYLNGTVLLPGQTYSMNDTVKERTEENGYTVGYIVGNGGRLQEAQGGGVSTVATATWVAAFYAGLERVEQRAHTIWIPRYTAGLEATVAWGFLDLKVRNDTGNAVLITATTTPTSITVSFWGTKKYSKIRAEFGEPYNVTPFDTITDGSAGCASNTGQNGFDIDVDRVFYKKGKEVRRETFTTNYIPAPRVICTGGGDRIQ